MSRDRDIFSFFFFCTKLALGLFREPRHERVKEKIIFAPKMIKPASGAAKTIMSMRARAIRDGNLDYNAACKYNKSACYRHAYINRSLQSEQLLASLAFLNFFLRGYRRIHGNYLYLK